MRNAVSLLPRRMGVALLLALQPIVVMLFTVSDCGAEISGPRWFAQAFEPLPMPAPQVEAKEAPPPGCEAVPKDTPLSALSTDIRPRDREGQVVPADGLPVDCAQHVFTEERFLSIGLTCETCRPRWCDVLGLARFCHRPLYFEEVCLERCGVRACCCQPGASAVHFFGRALMMPVLATCVCPCACVPAQYCF